jgi:hypothetical protein
VEETTTEVQPLAAVMAKLEFPKAMMQKFDDDFCLSCLGEGNVHGDFCKSCDGTGKWCPDCQGVHRVEKVIDRRKVSVLCDCRKEKQLADILDRKIPLLCSDAKAGFEGFSAGGRHPKQEIIFKTLQEQPERGLLVFGSTGVGKSHFGWLCYAEAIRRKQKAYHAVIDTLHDEFNAFSFGSPKGNRPELMPEDLRTNKHALVFLDEIDKLKNTASAIGFFFKLVDAAAYYKHRLILTSNVTLKELENSWNRISIAYGAPLIRRIKESCEIFDMRLAKCGGCGKQTQIVGREQCVHCASTELDWI